MANSINTDRQASMIETALQFDTNVDDMDPRLWPQVIDALLNAGAQDAWVTPILMKKGRPASTLSALCSQECAEVVRQVIFRETTTIGIRETTIRKHVLDRSESEVQVHGHTIGVKTAFADDGTIRNQSVEWDDVVAAAAAIDMPAKDVHQAAMAEVLAAKRASG